MQNKLEQLARPLEPMPGKHTPRLNCKVIECFIFNRNKLHHSTNNEDIKLIQSIDSGSLSSVHMDQLVPVPHLLALKRGCPVMLLRNTDKQLKNGSMGIVDYFINSFPVVSFDKENRVKFFGPHTMVTWFAAVKGKTGTRLQLPLTLSYSFSIHKNKTNDLILNLTPENVT